MTQSLWKLLPANPILLRVVTAGGRRLRHAFTRWIYLGLLIGVLLVALLATGTATTTSLGELAKVSTNVFAIISYVQLGMICLLAPIFTAGAITQERDSQTYNILLATPLTNSQIVLGSLFSRLYYVFALLLAGVPVFSITLFYGGVTGMNIALSFAIAIGTGLFMGSLAITIAVFRLGTGKTVFWFYVFNAVYLVALWLFDYKFSAGRTTWLTGIHPFLALQTVVMPTEYATPDAALLGDLWWPLKWYRAYPAYAYVVLTMGMSLLMVGPSALVLRRIAQRADVGLWQYLRHLILPRLENKTRRARHVWANPVAWREAATRAGASARGITRWLTIVIGVAAAVVLLWFYHEHKLTVEEMRQTLVGLVIVEFAVALLVATNTSASAVTQERESRTLDLLLVTPITSRYYIWGKLRGLVSFMLPFAAVPTVTVLLVVLYDLVLGNLRTSSAVVWPEAVIELPLFLTVLIAWACMLGLQLSLKWSRTIVAVMASVGVLAGVAAVLGVCGIAILQVPVVGLMFSALSPFTGICVILDPQHFAEKSFDLTGSGVESWLARVIMFVSYLLASGGYCMVVWAMYRSMVKNFDMIIRRQHQ